jgi:glycosyltransferase involved in cell wall biosynthesis
MPAYNAEAFIGEALDSLLGQTLADIEVIVVDDASTDRTAAVVSAAVDPRVRLVALDRNGGDIAARNIALRLARADLVAAMDADDVCSRERLRLQVDFLDRHPEIDVLGTQIDLIDGVGRTLGSRRYPLDHAAILRAMPRWNPLAHPTVLVRRTVLERGGGWQYMPTAGDYATWSRLAREGARFANLPDVLLHYRIHATASKRAKLEQHVRDTLHVQRTYWADHRSVGDRLYRFGEGLLLHLPERTVMRLFLWSRCRPPTLPACANGGRRRTSTVGVRRRHAGTSCGIRERRVESPSRPPTVVVWSAHFAPHVGGVERYTEGLWRVMAHRGWRVTVVSTATGEAASCEDLDGPRVIRLPAWRILEGRLPVPRPSPLLRRVWRDLTLDPPDLFVSNTRFFPTSVLAAHLARKTGRPLLHIEHGSDAVGLGRPVVDRLLWVADLLIGRWVVRRATITAGVSAAAARLLRRFGAHDAVVLYNGIDTRAWHARSGAARERLGFAEADVVVAHVGRLIEAKGVLDLLAAWDGMDGSHQGARLVIGGTGPLEEPLRRRAAADPRVHMLGRLSYDGVRDLLQAADVFVHPSAYPEGLPTVVLEAAAAGLPVIATPMGGTAEVIADGVGGIIVPPRDPAGLRDALLTLLDDASLRAALGANARRIVEERFDWEVVADRLEEYVAGLLDTPTVRRAPAG